MVGLGMLGRREVIVADAPVSGAGPVQTKPGCDRTAAFRTSEVNTGRRPPGGRMRHSLRRSHAVRQPRARVFLGVS